MDIFKHCFVFQTDFYVSSQQTWHKSLFSLRINYQKDNKRDNPKILFSIPEYIYSLKKTGKDKNNLFIMFWTENELNGKCEVQSWVKLDQKSKYVGYINKLKFYCFV